MADMIVTLILGTIIIYCIFRNFYKIPPIRELRKIISKSKINSLFISSWFFSPREISMINNHDNVSQPAIIDDDIVHTKFKPFHIIRSEEVGTFYRSYHEIETKGDEQEPLVFIGQIIEEGDIIGIINAMRLDIEIKSEFSGMIVEILVEDNTPVEFGQLLMFINPK